MKQFPNVGEASKPGRSTRTVKIRNGAVGYDPRLITITCSVTGPFHVALTENFTMSMSVDTLVIDGFTDPGNRTL